MYDSQIAYARVLIARMKLALSTNKTSVRYIPAHMSDPIEDTTSDHYIKMDVSRYTGATSTLAAFLCHRGGIQILEYLASLQYVGVEPIDIKFYDNPARINLPHIPYTSWMVIAVTEDGHVRNTSFTPEQCTISTYDEMCDLIRERYVDDDKPITRWVVIYANYITNQWDMTMSCIE